MAAVRTLIVLVVAFLLMRPVWVTEEKGERARPIAVLIDVSQSMDSKDPRPNPADLGRAAIAFGFADADKGLPDPSFLTSLQGNEKLQRPSRIDIARSILLQSKINFLPRLARLGPLQVFTFGQNRTGRDPAKDDWLKNLTADEPRTALVESAFELLNKDDTEAPAAIVLVTDGRENAGPGVSTIWPASALGERSRSLSTGSAVPHSGNSRPRSAAPHRTSPAVPVSARISTCRIRCSLTTRPRFPSATL